jgi:elongation factor G
MIGHPITGVEMLVNDGQAHPVDSNEMAFRIASAAAFRAGFRAANPIILEPIMNVEVTAPMEFQGVVVSNLNKRKGVVLQTETILDSFTVIARVSLNNMFGYSTDIRSLTQGKGEFSMEYADHQPVTKELQEQLVAEYAKNRTEEE